MATPDCSPPAASDGASALNVMAVYQDVQTRERITELRDRVSRSIGRQSLHLRLWSFRDLSEPEIFQEAVVAAMAADVVIVSIRATEKLPARFCGWIDSWVPRRHRLDGTLIALVDVIGQHGAALELVQTYLRGVAQKARLEFLLREYSAARADGPVENITLVNDHEKSIKN